MHPMHAVELKGDFAMREPLRLEHGSGLLAAADTEDIFAFAF